MLPQHIPPKQTMAIRRANFFIHFSFVLLLLTILTKTAVSQNCGTNGCAGNMCCSRYGYCGTTIAYCGTGCKSGPCQSGTPTPTPGEGGLNSGPSDTVQNIVTPTFFDSIISKVGRGCPANGFYTREGFITAAQSFAAYQGIVSKREIAAMFAQFSHESGSFCYKEEIARGKYCSSSPTYPCEPGKDYYGRGPIQITWNYNYGAAGKYLGLPLLTDPDMVARSPEVAFKCAMWFWNQNVRAVLDQGFGATTRKINGGECNGQRPTAVQSRVDRYLEFCRILGISPGTNLSC